MNGGERGEGMGEAGKNGEDFGFRRAARGSTPSDFATSTGHLINRKEKAKGKGSRDNSFPKWWENGIKD